MDNFRFNTAFNNIKHVIRNSHDTHTSPNTKTLLGLVDDLLMATDELQDRVAKLEEAQYNG